MSFSANIRKKQNRDADPDARVRAAARFGFFSLDETGKITEVNVPGAKMLGMDGAALVNKPFAAVAAEPAEAARLSAHLRDAAAREEGAVMDIRLRRTDGALFTATMQSCAAETAGGVRTTLTDVTKVRDAERAAQPFAGRLQLALRAAAVTVWDWAPGSGSVAWS